MLIYCQVMTMDTYRPRIADRLLKEALEAKGAVLVQGPKWCGKTTTALQIAKTVIRMDDPAHRDQYYSLASVNPSYLLEGEPPLLIDEWQLAPKLWDAVRYEVDRRGDFGQFILAGSSSPADKREITHTGTGRISKISMSTMTLFESGDSDGSVSLKNLFEGETEIKGRNRTDLYGLAFLVCRGGWPLAIGKTEKVALRQSRDYYESLVETDMTAFDNVERSEERVKLLLRSYSRNLCTQTKTTKIREDMLENDVSSLSEDTILSYIDTLKKIFAISELPAWNPNLRSKAAVRTSNTRHFTDPSIATAALGLGPKGLINDLKTFGIMFESMVVRDLRVYAQCLDGNLYHYRDSSGLESDAVMYLRNGDWAAFEIKLGTDYIDEAAKNLLKLKDNVNTEKMKEPSFLAVISGTAPFAYRRPDSVYVIPVDCLKY